jgi:hypothetical protein
VRFTRSTLVREILEARRVKRNVSTADIGWSDPPNYSIYVNESLTAHNRKLYSKARDLKKSGKLKYLWVRGGKIFGRKEDGSERFVLRTEEDLINLQ